MERDFDVPIARVPDAVFTRNGVELVVRGPELHGIVDRLVARLGRQGVFHGQLGGTLSELFVSVQRRRGDDHVVGAHLEGAFVIEGERDLPAALRKVILGISRGPEEIDLVRITHAVFALDGERVVAQPVLFEVEIVQGLGAFGDQVCRRRTYSIIGTTGCQHEERANNEKKNVSVQHSPDVSHPLYGSPRNAAHKLRENTS